jgi:hypothetical protein
MQMTGLIEAVITICEPCFDAALIEVEERRRQFAELLAGGMSREQANRIMIARIDGAAPG